MLHAGYTLHTHFTYQCTSAVLSAELHTVTDKLAHCQAHFAVRCSFSICGYIKHMSLTLQEYSIKLTICIVYYSWAHTSAYFNSYLVSQSGSGMLYLPVQLIVMTLEPLNSLLKSSCILMFNFTYAFSFKFLLYQLYAIRNLHMILFMMFIINKQFSME